MECPSPSERFRQIERIVKGTVVLKPVHEEQFYLILWERHFARLRHQLLMLEQDYYYELFRSRNPL